MHDFKKSLVSCMTNKISKIFFGQNFCMVIIHFGHVQQKQKHGHDLDALGHTNLKQKDLGLYLLDQYQNLLKDPCK